MFLAIPFVYVLNVLFWSKLGSVLKDIIREAGIKRDEWTVYACICLLFCVFIAYCFLKSQAFYGTRFLVDIIYTSDSPKLLKTNVFIVIDHIENDLRQPLFAIFAAPLMGIPSFLGEIIPGIPRALFIAFFQFILLMFSAFLLARALELSKVQRICFIVFSSLTYTYILFSIMIDQYVVAFFWLALTVYLMVKGKKYALLSSFAASGTLLTSGALVPFILIPKEKSGRSYKNWFINMLLYGFDFILLLLLSDRFHVLWNSVKNLNILIKFTGTKLGLNSRVLQYINYVSSCFFAPAAAVKQLQEGHSSWQLSEVTSVNYLGIILFVISVIGFIVTRRAKISQIAFGWLCFSIAVLVLAGWGTSENGLILYALYFGWPFSVLIFNLLKAVEHKTKTTWITPVATVISGVVLLIVNIPGMIDLVKFAVSEYPV